MMNSLRKTYRSAGQYLGALVAAPSKVQGLSMCFLVGIGIIALGTGEMSLAQTDQRYDVQYNDERIDEIINAIFTYLEGSFGALIMVAAGISAIVSSAFGQYKAALGLLVVAVGAFVLRSLVATFFNDENIA
ncbi:hypothetical protein MRY87_04345 [bacterium]|nr:hypothetical protein [bacterium]